jgi:hypothetical protein
MSGYLSRLAARSTQASAGLRPRAPAIFEADAPAPLDVEAGVTAVPLLEESTTPVAPPARRTTSPGEQRADVGPRRTEPRPNRPNQVDPVEPSEQSEPMGRVEPVAAVAQFAVPPNRASSPRPLAAPAAVRSPEPEPHPRLPDTRVAAVRPALEPTVGAARGPGDAAGPALPAPVVTVEAERPADPPGPVPPGAPEPRQPDRDVVLPRLYPGPPPPEPAPQVTVTIGRIEVVAPPAAPAAPAAAPPSRPAQPARPASAPALADYLRDSSRR